MEQPGLRRRAYLVANPSAGPRRWRAELKAAVACLRQQGWEIAVAQTRERGQAGALAQKAVAQGYPAVLACGGDGTVNEVIQALVGTPVALGLLPCGTANVFAHEVNIPLGPLAAAKALLGAIPRRLDVGRANGRYFLLFAGVGFDAAVVRWVEAHPKTKRAFGPLAFIGAGLGIGLSYRPTAIRLTLDGQLIQRDAALILVCNVRRYGLVTMAPQARPDDGLLEVFVFSGRGLGQRVRQFRAVLRGQTGSAPGVESYQARALHIAADHPLPIQVDGEPAGTTPLQCTVLPRAVTVLIPRGPMLCKA